MDEANQKMEALKKAYADIIFNTTKEAAAKIMVAERKAYQYQKEMCEAKQEALNMLARFKTMMDSKIAEEENISFNQRTKIEELEAQVHKAEDVANDLRAELKEVKEELEKMKNSRLKPLGKRSAKRSVASNEDASQENQLITSESLLLYPWDSGPGPLSSSNMKGAHLHQRHTIDHCSSASENVSTRTGIPSNSADENYDADNPDLLSMMRRIKDSRLHRSGRTQRIRAFKRKQLNGKSSPPVHSDNQSSPKKNIFGNTGLLEQNPTPSGELLQKDNSWDKSQDAMFFRVPCRKRGARSRKARTTLCTNQIMKAPVGTTLSRCGSDPCPDNSISKSIENPSGKIEETDHEASVFPLNPVSPFNTTNMDTKLGVDVRSDAEIIEAKSVQNAVNGDKVLIDESPLATEENRDTDSSEIPDLILNLEKVHEPLMNSDTKDDKNCEITKGAPAQTADDKFLKFTFRRKRKRASLTTPDGSVSLEINTSTKRPSEMQSNGPEPPKSSLTVESSRDDRRLMQVARQLVSLKDKKWWQ